jgi:DNA-binding SARP family transcriptional activator
MRLLLEPNRMVPVGKLVEAVWDVRPPTTAVHQIRKVASELRRRLPGGSAVIQTDRAGYRADVHPQQLDLSVFDLHMLSARKASGEGRGRDAIGDLQAAVDLWRGPVGVHNTQSLEALSSALYERYLSAHEQLAELRIGLGQAVEVVGPLQQLVAHNPLRERLCWLLMSALACSGRNAEALAVFGQVQRTLADELGIDPSRELRRLHESILRSEAQVSFPTFVGPHSMRSPGNPPCALPSALPDFTGRGPETVLMGSMIDRAVVGKSSVILIHGMPGSGKTSFVVNAAHAMYERFPDGRYFIDLRGYSTGEMPIDSHSAVGILLSIVGEGEERIPEDPVSRLGRWRVISASRRILLVLDNVKYAEQVIPLLPTADGTVSLITSRNSLDIDGADLMRLGNFTSEESMAFLIRVLGQDMVNSDVTAARDLVGACGGLPLALRLCASRIRSHPHWSVAHLVRRLRNEERILEEIRSPDRNLSTTFQLSYGAMHPPDQEAFRSIANLAAADFGVSQAAKVMGMDVDDAERALERLLAAGVIEQRSASRYTLHKLMKSYGRTVGGHVSGACRRIGGPLPEERADWRRGGELTAQRHPRLRHRRDRRQRSLPRGHARSADGVKFR